MSAAQKLLLSTYQLVNNTGLLRTSVAQNLFWHAYCAYKRYLEDPFAKLGQNYPELFKEGLIIDVGANIGYTAKVFCDLAQSDFYVVAFEPEPENYKQLTKNNQNLIADSKLIAVQAAVGAENGSVNLKLNLRHHADHKVVAEGQCSNSENVIRVKQYSLDSYYQQFLPNKPIAFVKIDVQGYELAVCQGMLDILSRQHACVALEFTPDSMRELGYDPDGIFYAFSERNYTLAVLEKSGKILKSSPKQIYNLLKDASYVDLLFLPEKYKSILDF